MNTVHINSAASAAAFLGLADWNPSQVWQEIMDERGEKDSVPHSGSRAPFWLKLMIDHASTNAVITRQERGHICMRLEQHSFESGVQALRVLSDVTRQRERVRCGQLHRETAALLRANLVRLNQTGAGRKMGRDVEALLKETEAQTSQHLMSLERAYFRLQGFVEGLNTAEVWARDTFSEAPQQPVSLDGILATYDRAGARRAISQLADPEAGTRTVLQAVDRLHDMLWDSETPQLLLRVFALEYFSMTQTGTTDLSRLQKLVAHLFSQGLRGDAAAVMATLSQLFNAALEQSDPRAALADIAGEVAALSQ